MSKIVEFPTAPAWLTKYYEKKLPLVFYPSKSKIPDDAGWPTKDYKIEDYRGQNVGLKLGTEITPGRFSADIDFDWVPGIPLSPGILPRTQCGFGHPPTKPISHALYTTPTPVTTRKFTNIVYDKDDILEKIAKSKQCFVEIRGLKETGEVGFQTMIPPSLWIPEDFRERPDEHPGEKLIYAVDEEWGHSDELPRRVMLFAIACILHANIPHGTFKHEMRLACAGYFLTNGLNREETTVVMKAVLGLNGPHDRGDEIAAIESTLRSINTKQRIAGRVKFSDLIGRYGDRVVSQIQRWLGNSEFLESKGKIIPNQENIRRAMDIEGIRFTYDEFACKPMVHYPGDGNGNRYNGEVEDNIRRKIWLEIERKHRFLPPKELYYDVTDDIAFENRFHPVMDYLKNLTWDHTPRIDTWVSVASGAEDSDYTRAVSRIMLMAAVRRVMQPGCKYDEMVIFESGTQGLLKSSALRTLCPNDDWFSDNLPLNLKAQELIELTAGKWIIEVAELNKIKATQIEHIKSLLSRQDDTARLAYRHDPRTQRRQCIFVGTTNSYTYLTDQTGNRRFWPIRIKKFNIEWLKANRDQIWAEAFAREQAGESIRLAPELYKSAEAQQNNRLVDDDWKLILDQYFDKQHQRIANDEIWEQLAVPVERRTSVVSQRVAEVMQALGFVRATQVRDRTGKPSRGWKRDPIYTLAEWEEMHPKTVEDTDMGEEKLQIGSELKKGIDDL